jgi:hypothetical protein
MLVLGYFIDEYEHISFYILQTAEYLELDRKFVVKILKEANLID